jgi:diguanylate cyclase (GGDEF)-like protein
MAHAFAAMIAFGAALASASLIANLTPDDNHTRVLLLTLGGFPTAFVAWRFPQTVTKAMVAWVLIPVVIAELTLGIWLSGDPTNPATGFYGPLILFSAYYMPRRTAVRHLAFFAVVYAAAMFSLAGPDEALDRWLFGVGMATLSAGVVAHLRDRLEAQAKSDWLTGIANRRGFDARLRRMAGCPYGLLLLDIDHFKGLNDAEGHHAGDAALVTVANALVRVAGHENVARLGGDEFAAIFPGADESETGLQAMAVRRVISADDLAPTISLGVAASPVHGEGDAVVKAADLALYQAKRGGRDRTVIAATA